MADRVKQSRSYRELAAMALAVEATSKPMAITDMMLPDNPISYANKAFVALCGYPQEEIIGRNARFLQGPETDPAVRSEIHAAVASGVGIRREILNYRKDGSSYWTDLTIDPIRDAKERLIGFVSSQADVTESRQAEEARAESQSRLESIVNHVSGFFFRCVMHADGNIDIVYCSTSLSIILGIHERDVTRSFVNHVHPADRSALAAAMRTSAANLSIFRTEFRLVTSSGVTRWMRSEAPPRRSANGEIVWDGLAVEISAEKQWATEMAGLTRHDPLTRLLTRDAWRQALVMQLGGEAQSASALLYFDIEAFHDLNEKFGQRAGDDVLREIAQRIATIAASVEGVAARLGGDEFAILLPVSSSADTLHEFALTAGRALGLPIRIGDMCLSVRLCIGASVSRGGNIAEASENDAVDEIMIQAELALRWAKQAGSHAPVVYSAAKDDRFRSQALLARSLEHAIAHDELELHYQPLVDLASGRIVSAEALVRWNHPTLGLQRPDLFIPLAESSGLIVQLGHWVLRRALTQSRLWREAGLMSPPIAINVSGTQLIDPGFVDFVRQALAMEHAEAGDFEFELTEGELIEASPQIMASLHALRGMGFKIAIDDFGSGHATFRYLRDFPVSKLKLDQLFVRKLVLGSNDALIIRAVISLARSMGIAFVAEGIESDMQRDFLRCEGCEIGQGYFFSMPLVPEDFGWMLANDVRLPLRASPMVSEPSQETELEPK